MLLANQRGAVGNVRIKDRLSQLIHPLDEETFRQDYWERRPLVMHRDDPGYYADLLTLDDVDHVLSLTGIGLDSVRVVLDGNETPVAKLASEGSGINVLEALYERYRVGSTIVLNALEQRWEPLQQLSRALGAELSCRIQMNVYCTPASSQGFAPHYDMHDVFVAQVHGSKHWRLASQPYRLPLEGTPYDKSRPAPDPEQEVDLCAGDVMYLPRGTVHWATSGAGASAHITIGVHPVLYSQVISDALRDLFAEDVRFRKGFPAGFAADASRQREAADALAELLDVVRAKLSPQDMVAASAKRAASMGLPALRHHLIDLEQLDAVTPGTSVRRRPGQRWHLTVTDDVASLDFHDKTVQLPASVADAVQYVAESNGEGFTPADIPGDLDEPGRLVLVRTLLREGFLTLG
jgi:ribosomal protein L16 Arg81 hydroxylase